MKVTIVTTVNQFYKATVSPMSTALHFTIAADLSLRHTHLESDGMMTSEDCCLRGALKYIANDVDVSELRAMTTATRWSDEIVQSAVIAVTISGAATARLCISLTSN